MIQSEKCNFIPNLVWFNKIHKLIALVCVAMCLDVALQITCLDIYNDCRASFLFGPTSNIVWFGYIHVFSKISAFF